MGKTTLINMGGSNYFPNISLFCKEQVKEQMRSLKTKQGKEKGLAEICHPGQLEPKALVFTTSKL